jgi:hypothetical protein
VRSLEARVERLEERRPSAPIAPLLAAEVVAERLAGIRARIDLDAAEHRRREALPLEEQAHLLRADHEHKLRERDNPTTHPPLVNDVLSSLAGLRNHMYEMAVKDLERRICEQR